MDSIFCTPLLNRVIFALPEGAEAYLVGGAVRDALLGLCSNDLDFVLPGDTLRIARELADTLGGAYFPLDTTREYARIVLSGGGAVDENQRVKLDFATFQGGTFESDLRLRDFTINAMAVNVHHLDLLIDPFGGARDLLAKKLRACTPEALQNDPVRVLRAVRLALKYDLQILPETIKLMRQASGLLEIVSPERIRDELFHLLECKNPRTGLDILDRIGALEVVLPELGKLKAVDQSAPHIYDTWNHTLEGISRLEAVLMTLTGQFDAENASNLLMGLASIQLGRYRHSLEKHLAERLNPDRSMRSLLFLAVLYHDAGKPFTRKLDEHNKLRFLGHDQQGETLAIERALGLHLSNVEIQRLGLIVRHHMRPFLMGQTGELPTRRAIYRFFRDTGEAGVDICLLSLADMLATYGPTLPQELWVHHLEVVRNLLSAWWEHPQEQVSPKMLVNGYELMTELGLQPGPKIGQLLEAIREAQAMQQIHNREQALEYARGLLDQG